LHFCRPEYKVEITQEGQRQFLLWTTEGVCPEKPDKYFLCLKDGKFIFDLTYKQYREQWGTDDWPGWYSIEEWFKDEQWVLPYLFNWSGRYE
jgi:hypothetical protein